MLVFELRWLLFGLLLFLVITVAARGSIDRRLHRQGSRRRRLPGLLAVLPDLEQAPCGVLLLDGPRTYRSANAVARRLLGLAQSAGALPDAGWVHLLDADRGAVRETDTARGRYRTVSLAPDHPDQAQPEQSGRAMWWVTPLAGGDLVFLLDATGQQRSEEAMRSLVNDLAHELRTPLATVLTHLEVLSLAQISDEARQQSMSLIRGEVNRMVRLLHQMLELGRLQAGVDLERRSLDLLAVARETVMQMGPAADERGIALSLEADPGLPLIEGDEDRLRQVFLNLIDNALKYSRPGDAVLVSLRREDQHVRCMVRDSGPGIPAEHLASVTRRFFRAAPGEVAGSGLGLTLVEGILRRHGSALEIESHSAGGETGTCARFLLTAAPCQRSEAW